MCMVKNTYCAPSSTIAPQKKTEKKITISIKISPSSMSIYILNEIILHKWLINEINTIQN